MGLNSTLYCTRPSLPRSANGGTSSADTAVSTRVRPSSTSAPLSSAANCGNRGHG